MSRWIRWFTPFLLGMIVACGQEEANDIGETEPAGGASKQDVATPSGPASIPAAASTPDHASTAPAAADAAKSAKFLEQAWKLMLQERVVEALPFFDDAIAAAPDNTDAHAGLGQALLRDSPEQDLDEAMTAFRRADELGHPAAKVWMARIDVMQAAFDEAETLLDTVLSASSSPPPGEGRPWLVDAHLRKALVLIHQEHFDEARKHLDEAAGIEQVIVANPEARKNPLLQRYLREIDIDADLARAEVAIGLEQFDDAQAIARDLIARYRELISAREMLARACEAAGEEQVAADQRRVAELLQRAGEVVTKKSVPLEEVEATFNELARLDPEYRRCRLRLARALVNRGETERAVSICRYERTMMQGQPGQARLVAESWFIEGRAWHLARRAQEALECYRRAARIEPGFRGHFEALKREIKAKMRGGR